MSIARDRWHALNIERCFELLGEEIDDSPCPVIDAMAKEGQATLKKTDDALLDASCSSRRPSPSTTRSRYTRR